MDSNPSDVCRPVIKAQVFTKVQSI